MAYDFNSADVRAELNDLVAAISAQLVLGDAPVEMLMQALSRLAEQANRAGNTAAGRMAAELAEKARLAASADAAHDALAEGLARIESLLAGKGDAAETAGQGKAAPLPLSSDPELLADFIQESRDHLASVEKQLLVLERDPCNSESLHSVFRSFHTIKGLAGFMEFGHIQQVAHDVETVLDLARNGQRSVTPHVTDVVLESADYLSQSITAVEADLTGREFAFERNCDALLAKIRALLQEDEQAAGPPQPAGGPPRFEPPPDLPAAPPPPAATPGQSPDVPSREAASEPRRADAAAETSSLRVDTAKLDHLMDMVGEMVIAQSLVRHNPSLAGNKDRRLLNDLAQLTRITSEVQRTAMAMRMVPVGRTFKRLVRLVRDLSRKIGKQAELITAGEQTELDKTVAEELADPLMHMVRNALDHGMETPAERQAAGKPPTGTIRLAAYHHGGQIVIELADDGRGLSRDKILRKAVQRGLADPNAQLSDAEVYGFLFEPGFSTAEQVTEVSGRGVGLDVVRKHVQKLRGRVDVQSDPGRGTRFFLRLPLTLAIIEGLVVGVGGQRYIIPVYAVRQMIRPSPAQVSTVQGKGEMALVRDRLLPLVRLHRRFNVEPRTTNPCDALLVVAESEGRRFCLMVDHMIGKQEVVIKSLGDHVKNIRGVAGGAILGDGRVGLILDMETIFSGVANG